MRKIQLFDPIYKRIIIFAWGCSIEDFTKYLNKKYDKLELEEFDAKGYFVELGNKEKKQNHFWIWAEKFEDTLEDEMTIAHEVIHCVFGVFKYLGIGPKNDEAFCYYYEFLLKQILKFLKPRNILRRATKKGIQKANQLAR